MRKTKEGPEGLAMKEVVARDKADTQDQLSVTAKKHVGDTAQV